MNRKRTKSLILAMFLISPSLLRAENVLEKLTKNVSSDRQEKSNPKRPTPSKKAQTKSDGRDPSFGLSLSYSTQQISPDYNRLHDLMNPTGQQKGFILWPRFIAWQAQKGHRTRRYLLLGAFYETMKAKETYDRGDIQLTSKFWLFR